jgi:hypothetical protein
MHVIGEIAGARSLKSSNVLRSDRFINGKSIYWRLTICRMTRYRRVSSGNRGNMSKVRDLFPLPFGDTGDAEPAFSDTLLIS